MAEELKSLAVVIKGSTDDFNAKMADVDKTLGKVKKSIDQAGKNFQKVGTQFAAVGGAIVGALGLIVEKSAAAGEEIYNLSAKTGFSTEALSKFKYVAEQSGTSLSIIETAAKAMSKALVDATENGTSPAAKAITALGLNIEELRGMKPEDQFWALAGALGDVEDKTLQVSLASDLFGKSSQDLLPIIANGKDGITSLKDEAVKLNAVWSEDSAKAAADFEAAKTKLTTALEGIGTSIATALMPMLQQAAGWLTDKLNVAMAWLSEHPEVSKALLIFGAAIATIGGALLVISQIIKAYKIATEAAAIAQWLLNVAMDANPIGLIVIAVAALIAIIVLLVKNWDKVGEVFGAVWEGIKTGFKAAVNFMVGLAEGWVNFHIKAINFIIGAFNKIHFEIPDWVPLIGGKSFGINIPLIPEITLPRLAKGGKFLTEGYAMVGENGPEVASFPAGASVAPLDRINSGMGGSPVINIYNAGSVISERDLLQFIRDGLYGVQGRNGSLGFT